MLFTTVPQTCRTVCYHMRQNASFQYLSLVLPCGLDSGQVIEKDGERGRNRTFNLLIKSQLLCQLSYAPRDRPTED
jgi:hypothetical protein